MIRFSVVIPVYKVEPYLDECVSSVVMQRFRDLEVILVDDGSPDNCGKMCDDWAEKDNRIRVVHQENGGLSAARNTGIRNAAGEYVLFLDSDDWWADADVLGTIDAQLQKTPVDVVSYNYRKSYHDKLEPLYFPETLPDSQQSETLAQMTQGDRWINGACNKAIRRELLVAENLYFRTGITSEDIDWTLRLALKSRSFAFVNVCVFIYRQHASSISHSATPKKIECLCNNVCECVRLLNEAEANRAELMKPFVAYQYGTLFYNVAALPAAERSQMLMKNVKQMRHLLTWSNNSKVRLIRLCNQLFGLKITFWVLRMRQRLQEKSGKGV